VQDVDTGRKEKRKASSRGRISRERRADYVCGRAAAKKMLAETKRAREKERKQEGKERKGTKKSATRPRARYADVYKARVKKCTTPPYPSRMPMRNRTRPRTRVRVRVRVHDNIITILAIRGLSCLCNAMRNACGTRVYARAYVSARWMISARAIYVRSCV